MATHELRITICDKGVSLETNTLWSVLQCSPSIKTF